MGQDVLGGAGGALITIALVTVFLGVLVGGVLYQHEVVVFARHHLLERVSPPEPPVARPIERIASDVRRVRDEFCRPAPGLPMARRVALSRAYDDLLLDACRALGVPDSLSGLPPGTERDAERLYVEHELTRAGLRLSA